MLSYKQLRCHVVSIYNVEISRHICRVRQGAGTKEREIEQIIAAVSLREERESTASSGGFSNTITNTIGAMAVLYCGRGHV